MVDPISTTSTIEYYTQIEYEAFCKDNPIATMIVDVSHLDSVVQSLKKLHKKRVQIQMSTGAPMFITTNPNGKAGLAMAGIVNSESIPTW